MTHFREATLQSPCASCGGYKVQFEMTTVRRDGQEYYYRVGTCRECSSQRFAGLRTGVSPIRPEGSPLDPHKCHYEVPADRWSGRRIQCSSKKGQGPGARYCGRHASLVAAKVQSL